MGLVLYNIPTGPCFSANPIYYKVGTDKSLVTTGLYIEALIEFMAINGTTWGEVIKLPLTPDGKGIVELDISRIAGRLLSFTTPSPTTAEIKESNTQTGFIRVRFTEYDITGSDDTLLTNQVTIAKGGISHERFQVNTFWQNRFPNYKLFTWLPRTREMRTWVPDYISFMHDGANITGATAKFTITYTDSTTTTTTLSFPGNIARTAYMYHIPCGYKNLNLGAITPEKKIWYYTMQVMDGATPVSELQTFQMQYDAPYEQYYLCYFNSLGGFESIPLLGEHSFSATRDYDLVDINTSRSAFNGNTVPAMSRLNRVAEQTSFKANIGVLHEWTLHDLRRELFLSREIYTLRNNRWWPVNILDKSLDFGPVSAQVKEVAIEWSFAFSNTHYTPEDSDLGEPTEFEFATTCPNLSYSIFKDYISISFTHEPAPVDIYELRLFDSTMVQVGATATKTIPYSAPITHTFNDLDPETDYHVKIIMYDTASGLQRECLYSQVTTLSEDAEEPEVPESFSFFVKLSDHETGICSVTDTLVYSTSPILGTEATIFMDAALTVPVYGYLKIVLPFGYIYDLDGNTILDHTGNSC